MCNSVTVSVCLRHTLGHGGQWQAHPALVRGTPENEIMSADGSGELCAEAVELHLNAGDALLFVDCMLHGSARRINPGERRIFIARCEYACRNIFDIAP